VKVTDWPKTEGLVADVTDALVASWLTVWVRAGLEVLVVKSVSPS